MTWSLRVSLPITVVALIGVGGCGGAAADVRDGEDATSTEGGAVAVAASEVPTNSWPADPCGWIPVAEVESIVGPLVGPPRPEEGDCFYPLPLDAEMKRRRELAAKLEEVAKELARRQGEQYEPIPDRRPSVPGLLLGVNVSNSDIGERAFAAVGEMLGGSGIPDRTAPNEAQGWDYARSPFAFGLPGFAGRTGQLAVTVRGQATFLPEEKMAALATRVRDLIPDRPFAARDARQVRESPPAGPDPCGLMTRAEVEAVLGALVVPPYRTNETSPYPDPGGRSCAYYTAGHHVLVVTPEWTGGKQSVEISRGVGGLIGAVAPDREAEAADTLEGTWDDVVANGHAAELLFLKGDRALTVGYGASSTNAAGVIRLIGPALERLAAARLP